MNFETLMSHTAFPAVTGLAGVLIGGVISAVPTWLVKRKELRLRVFEKVLDKRIEAHEEIVRFSTDMHAVAFVNGAWREDASPEANRYPIALENPEAFARFCVQFRTAVSSHGHWLRTDLVRELNFLQDYLVNLDQRLSNVAPERYVDVGVIVKQDFIDLSLSIAKTARKFFESELHSMRLSKASDWHKYKREETEKRLHQTCLLVREKEIQALSRADSESEDE